MTGAAEQQEERRQVNLQEMMVSIARLTVLVETGEKARVEDVAERRIIKHDIGTILNALNALPALSEKLSMISASMTRDLAEHSATINRELADIRAVFTKDIAEVTAACAANTKDIQEYKTWRAGLDGASGAYKKVAGWVWALVGTMGGLLVSAFIAWYQTKGGIIGGE